MIAIHKYMQILGKLCFNIFTAEGFRQSNSVWSCLWVCHTHPVWGVGGGGPNLAVNLPFVGVLLPGFIVILAPVSSIFHLTCRGLVV